jgi:hypothetical protein
VRCCGGSCCCCRSCCCWPVESSPWFMLYACGTAE